MCGAVTGGVVAEAVSTSGSVPVRLSVTVTAQGRGGPASTAQQVFSLVLVHRATRWLINFGQW